MCNATVADCGGHGLLKAYQCLCDAGWSSNYSVVCSIVLLNFTGLTSSVLCIAEKNADARACGDTCMTNEAAYHCPLLR